MYCIFSRRKKGSMRINNFMRLSAAECAQFYPAVRANAQRHNRAADTLQKTGDYGNAIAHRILGSEEMVKALILFLEGKGMDLRSLEAIKPLFKFHVPRHKVFKTLFSALHALHTMSSASQLSFGKALLTLLKGGLETYFNTQWWKNAERYKQNAFYADHQGVFNDPLKLTREDCDTAYNYTRTVNERMADVINYVSKMDTQELAWFKESFHTTDFPELLEEITKVSSKKN